MGLSVQASKVLRYIPFAARPNLKNSDDFQTIGQLKDVEHASRRCVRPRNIRDRSVQMARDRFSNLSSRIFSSRILLVVVRVENFFSSTFSSLLTVFKRWSRLQMDSYKK